MKHYIFIMSLAITQLTFAQNNRQNIRGAVIDKLSHTPLIGANVQLTNSPDKKGSITDLNGNYLLAGISPGRHEIRISYIGYKHVTVSNVVVTSGKETIADAAMEEDLKALDEVVISANTKDKPINDLAAISTRGFTTEEVNRYAGGRSDPARLAANFAGVSAPDDSRNDIVIRGNSPVGVLWRINGMNVTNPNHFASVGTTGGAVSALNTNMLKNSDFLTSAFPAEYGNATSGVFDLGFRNGNTKERETTLQFGVITGLEATTEGPISEENGSSYLAGYRYSLAGVANAVGIDYGTTAIPSYQDLTFNINSGNTSFGRFTLFGILAASSIKTDGGNSGSLYGGRDGHDFSSYIDIVGLNHVLQLNTNSFLSSSVGVNYSKTNTVDYATDRVTSTSYSKGETKFAKTEYNASTSYNSKMNAQLFIKVGIQEELLGLNLYYREKERIQSDWKQIWDNDGYTSMAQAFVHVKYSMNEYLTLNTGIHAQKLFLNNSLSVEPRFALKYDLNEISSVSVGYGLHSQMQPINVYYLQTENSNGSYSYNNKNLDFTKSHQFVLGYDVQPFEAWRINTEAYYQYLYDVPVNRYASTYSMLNTGASFKTDLADSLVNNGTGRNYGIELTVEKFFSDGYYGLCTASLYDSKYTASDGVERNTAFNGKYVFNFLFGKEWNVGGAKQNTLSSDIKITNAGGRYYTPIDVAGSQLTGRMQSKGDDYAYTSRYANYFRMDIKVGYTLNSSTSQISHSFSLDLQNVTNNKNVFSEEYDDGLRAIKTTYQLGFFPDLTYKLQF
jgi:hypothetical protein